MSQPMSQGLQRKLGIEPDTDQTMGRDYTLPAAYERLRKSKRKAVGQEPREYDGSVWRDFFALLFMLVGLVCTVTASSILFGGLIGLLVFGAFSLILGFILGVL